MVTDRLISLPRLVKGSADGQEMPAPSSGWRNLMTTLLETRCLRRQYPVCCSMETSTALSVENSYGGPIRQITFPDPWEVECEWDSRTETGYSLVV